MTSIMIDIVPKTYMATVGYTIILIIYINTPIIWYNIIGSRRHLFISLAPNTPQSTKITKTIKKNEIKICIKRNIHCKIPNQNIVGDKINMRLWFMSKWS